jgi:hypothetical protein
LKGSTVGRVMLVGCACVLAVLPSIVWAQPTPTPAPYQRWAAAVDSTPYPTPVASEYYVPDCWARPSLLKYFVPPWRLDLNQDGHVNSGDTLVLSAYVSGHVDLATPVATATPTLTATFTPCATCEPGGGTPCAETATPVPTSTPWGGSNLTVEQGTDFVNGMHATVLLLGILIPCSVAMVVSMVFLFFKGR